MAVATYNVSTVIAKEITADCVVYCCLLCFSQNNKITFLLELRIIDYSRSTCLCAAFCNLDRAPTERVKTD